jgi:hypothetical protein
MLFKMGSFPPSGEAIRSMIDVHPSMTAMEVCRYDIRVLCLLGGTTCPKLDADPIMIVNQSD